MDLGFTRLQSTALTTTRNSSATPSIKSEVRCKSFVNFKDEEGIPRRGRLFAIGLMNWSESQARLVRLNPEPFPEIARVADSPLKIQTDPLANDCELRLQPPSTWIAGK